VALKNGKKDVGENLRAQRAECARYPTAMQSRDLHVRDLIERALPRRFVFSPPNDSCAVTKTVASEMIVGYF
jgi:hypothetical protein